MGDFFSGVGRRIDGFFGTIDSIADVINAEIDSAGIFGKGAEDWGKRSARLAAQVAASALPPGSGVDGPAFVKELEALTGATFTAGNTVTLLADGPAAWEARKAAIAGATSDIKLMTWAFYDDATGLETAQRLVDKAKQGVRVSVMVDFDVAQKQGHREALALLETAAAQGLPVQVARWENPRHAGQGQHMKYLVIDHGQQVISGGRNPGDVYYERGDKAGWKDAEVQLRGPAAGELNRAFVKEWNQQAALHNALPDPVDALGNVTPRPQRAAMTDATRTAPATGPARSAVVEHVPGGKESNITVATLKAIRGAKTSFTMANAYLLSLPAVREELKAAVKRGVEVKVLTNSAESIDETAITAPILETVKELAAAGVKMFLQRNLQPGREGTSTLHSKYWVADGQLSSMQSHNEHPRSDYYEREVAVLTLDRGAGRDLEADFAALTAPGRATAITSADQVKVPDDLMTRFKAGLVKGLFFRQS